MYFGPACECDDFSCDVDSRGLVCGGKLRLNNVAIHMQCSESSFK